MAELTFTQTNIIGDKYLNVFKMDNDTTQEVETTEADYKQLATSEHVDPTIEGGEWVSSNSRRKLDTPDGDLHDGEYFNDGGSLVAQYDGSIVSLTSEELVDGKVEQSIVEEKILNF